MTTYMAIDSFSFKSLKSTDNNMKENRGLLLDFDNGDEFHVLAMDNDLFWLVNRAKTDTVGYVPSCYLQVAHFTEKHGDNEIQMDWADERKKAEAKLKQNPHFIHPGKLYTSDMIPSPDYSDNESDSVMQSNHNQQLINTLNQHITRLMTKPPGRGSTSSETDEHTQQPEEQLIYPKKLSNPCLLSKEKLDLHRELKFNQKAGKSVLNQKTELQKVMTKFQEDQKKKEFDSEKLTKRSSFERKLEEQANKIKQSEETERLKLESPTTEQADDGTLPEFLRVHAKVRAKIDAK